jgi:hypothetical protein
MNRTLRLGAAASILATASALAGGTALGVAKPVVGKVKPSFFFSGDREALRNLSSGPAKCF